MTKLTSTFCSTIRSVIVLLAVFATFSQAKAGDLPNPSPAPVNKCGEISTALNQVYQSLYDVDTRPLSIESYRAYRDSIQILHEQIGLLQSLCNGAVPPSSQQTLYKSKNFAWRGPYNYNNPCGSTDLGAVKAEFQETSIRECFSEGFSDCSAKLPARAFGVSGNVNNDGTWNCSAKFDLVLNVSK